MLQWTRWLPWGIALFLYIIFTFWYTNTGGALTDDEVDAYVERLRQLNPESNLTRFRNFLAEDTGRQFMMVNLMDMAEDPPPVEGAGPDETAEQLMGRYMEHMYPALFSRACHPAYFGDAVAPAMDLLGIEGADDWTGGALMRYRSRRDLAEIATNPAFQGRHDFKVAALEKTIAYPVENTIYFSDPRFLLLLMLFSLCAAIELIRGRVRHGTAKERDAAAEVS